MPRPSRCHRPIRLHGGSHPPGEGDFGAIVAAASRQPGAAPRPSAAPGSINVKRGDDGTVSGSRQQLVEPAARHELQRGERECQQHGRARARAIPARRRRGRRRSPTPQRRANNAHIMPTKTARARRRVSTRSARQCAIANPQAAARRTSADHPSGQKHATCELRIRGQWPQAIASPVAGERDDHHCADRGRGATGPAGNRPGRACRPAARRFPASRGTTRRTRTPPGRRSTARKEATRR